MKRFGNLWPQITAFENLYFAYRKARRAKRRSSVVSRFDLNLEHELFRLQQALVSGSYQPGDYFLFTIYEPKQRIIAAAPFADRVVHHALMRVVEPLLDPRLIDDTYACRKNKGVHKAVDRYQAWSQRYAYALQMDIRQYFPSIDRLLLKQKLRRYLKDNKVLWLFERIIDHAPKSPNPVYLPGDDLLTPLERPSGLPIGNLTSQFLANFYLNDFDQFIKHHLKCPAYLRYMDDFIILDNDLARLHDLKAQIREKLLQDRLRLHPNKAHIVPTRCGLDVLGYFVYPHCRRVRNANGYRFRRKLKKFARLYRHGKLNLADVEPSLHSWIGHARHADTEGLRKRMFYEIVFSRA